MDFYSAYRTDGNHTLRISNHSSRAENFTTNGENLSVVLLKTNKTNRFNDSDSADVIEVQFKKDYPDRNPESFKNLVKDMARFVATGEYPFGSLKATRTTTSTYRTHRLRRLEITKIPKRKKIVTIKIYTGNYTMFATNVIETEKFKSASPEERAILLEGARELAGFRSSRLYV